MSAPLPSQAADHDAALVAEALRVYRRYAREVVEAFNLCPWAERARAEGRVVERVLLTHTTDDLDTALHALAKLAPQTRIEIALLIFPRLELGRLEFERFTSALRDADANRHALGEAPFATAAFHPNAAPDTSDAERLIPFLRRTPDPTIQVVRRSALDRVRGNKPQGTSFVDLDRLDLSALSSKPERSLRERIASVNLDTISELGINKLEALLDDIKRDRDQAYARIQGARPALSV